MIGLRELAILAAVVLVLYGRSGVLKSRQFQSIWPWISPARRASGRPGTPRTPAPARPRSQGAAGSSANPGRPKPFLLEGNRLFWFLTILAATAVAALIVTRLLILKDAGHVLTR